MKFFIKGLNLLTIFRMTAAPNQKPSFVAWSWFLAGTLPAAFAYKILK
jgi:hypothetical protein